LVALLFVAGVAWGQTPTPAPTPPGPQCALHVEGPGEVYLVAVYAHEGGDCARYSARTINHSVGTGGWRLVPHGTEGLPVGYEWWNGLTDELLKSCGDTSREYECSDIFSDGFESGNTSKWSRVQ
jgi:hypothetical protein